VAKKKPLAHARKHVTSFTATAGFGKNNNDTLCLLKAVGS
jgi:hypothetical protein